jgi:hypothetical protein
MVSIVRPTPMLGEFAARRTLPRRDWIQVEVSLRCNALCRYCPRTIHRKAWLSPTMPLRDFERLATALARVGMAHRQCRGEPFLNARSWR